MPRGFFDPGAGLGPHMEDELPAIGIRKEILAEPGGQRENRQDAAEENWQKILRFAHERGEEIPVAEA